MITFPQKIENELLKVLNKSDGKNWVKSGISLSLKYRAERIIQGVNYISDLDDVLGYLALRVSSTYSQIYGSLLSIKELNPSWKPTNVLDIGSGPGTAVWAALEVFPTIKKVIAIERDKNFLEIGKAISRSLSDVQIEWQAIELGKSSYDPDESFDLVIVANVLNEMDEKNINTTIEFVKHHNKGIVLIVEPGTPHGFKSLTFASKQFKTIQDILIAPYIENTLINSEEVSFVERIKRPEFQKRVRQMQRKIDKPEKSRLMPPSDWEESKYYYLAYSKFKPEISPIGRIVEKPKMFKPFIQLKVLTKDGVNSERIFKKDKTKYKLAKKLKWGSIVNADWSQW